MPEGMSVGFLVTGYPTPSGGSTGVFHRNLAGALRRAGASVEVVAPLPRVPWPLASVNGRWRRYSEIPETYRLDDVLVHRPRYWQVPRGNLVASGHGGYARCLRQSLTREPAVIHAHFAYPCGVAALAAARTWRAPVVLTLHGSDVNVLPEVSARARRHVLAAVRGASFVSAVSEALADRTERLTGRRPVVMPIGIDLRQFRSLPDRAAAREALDVPERAKVVLFVGALVESKGVSILLEALQRMGREDVLALFAGEGPLGEAVAAAPRTRRLGAVAHEKIPAALRAADVLVLPSYSEGMPTILVEAGAAGVPIIATAVGGIPELLGEGRGRLIPAGDVAALVQALEDVLGRPERAGQSARLLQTDVEERYDVDRNARTVLRVYESLQ
jgi:teichuronic acid biosynthesis glycosyltransferase TuaC